MPSGKVRFYGVDPYHFTETGEVVVTVTTGVGQSTAIGPKVAVCRRQSIATSNTDSGTAVIGTIDASIYRKNSNQDNFKYIIKSTKRNNGMAEQSPAEVIKAAIGDGKDVLGIIALTDTLLGVVEDGAMTIKDAREALSRLKESIADTAQEADGVTEVIDDEELDGETCVVRRLTPTETARLQGIPDDYTKIDGAETADAPQFKAHGNSWATPCANFVSTRVDMELRRLGHEGTIKYATCCSGIEAHSVSVRNLDWAALFFSEIEPFPCRILEKHYPTVPNLGDMTQIHLDAEKGVITNEPEKGYELPSCFRQAEVKEIPFKVGDMQVFSGGTPCQDISVAGKRKGMAEGSGSRSSLAFHFQRIIDESRPTFTIWENVPGAFSSNNGADFIWFVNRCAESGYSMAWRVLDAQYTMTEEFPRAVPQRRRRIWLVGFKGNDWRIPARVVFESAKALTDNPPDRIPGLGFKSLNPDVDAAAIRDARKKASEEVSASDLFDLFSSGEDNEPKAKKVSQMIPLDDFPNEGNFAKVRMVDVYEFAKKIGEPGYLGDVFRTDKKTASIAFRQLPEYKEDEEWLDGNEAKALYEKMVAAEKAGELEWEGAEKISPQILENIGNSGILANGRVLTMNCREWTGGIQLTPKTYSAWEVVMQHKDWLKANNLLPEAYDETVCGLSDVLEEDPDEKYNLSWRACFGILRRAETRGKELPKALYIALISTIRNNAGIVKWVALNGRDTKKKDTDLTERESAKMCFDKYISQVANFADIEAIRPKKKSDDEIDEDDEQSAADFDMENGLDDGDSEGTYWNDEKLKQSDDISFRKDVTTDETFQMNGCMNEGGGEVAPTIVSSQFKGPGNTQDGSVVVQAKK